ncbi:YolD-like family protein [Fictibacillus phosphorivorans]|uniref:YolD-like family protein n=1 Tax=Fictibacillus phosphorivorans TaxID=1221500 RepID=UPI003CF6FA01
MIRDRGNIKWQGMFLPEHVKLLREYDRENKKKIKPELDEQQLELMQETICDAMENNLYLCFTYFQNDDFRLMIGKVHYVDQFRGELRIMDKQNELQKIKLNDLINVSYLLEIK